MTTDGSDQYESHGDDEAPVGGDDRPAPDAEEEQDRVDAAGGRDPDSDAGDAGDAAAGDAADALHQRPDDGEVEVIEHDREERLDPDNRPDGAEVDNTDRDFDSEKGMFTDSDGYEQADERFPPAAEQGV